MNSKQLRYFREILRQGGFSAAARTLHIAQPALSGHVADLEAELGVKLLERTNRGVVATSAGRRLGQHADSIMRQIDMAKADVRGGGQNPSGEVLLALPLTSAGLLAGRFVKRVQSAYPDINLTIIEGLSSSTGNVMSSGRGDLALMPNAADVPNLEVMPLFWENLYLVGRWDGKRDRRSEVNFHELSHYPLILASHREHIRRAIDEAVMLNGVALNLKYQPSGMNTMFSLLNEGLCYSIINWPLIQTRWDQNRLEAHKIVSPEIRRMVSLVWPKDRPVTDAVAAVRKLLIELLREVVANGEWPVEAIGLMNDDLL